jgi:hypothetical protein
MCNPTILKMMINPAVSMTGFGNQKTQSEPKQNKLGQQTKVNKNKKQIKGTE